MRVVVCVVAVVYIIFVHLFNLQLIVISYVNLLCYIVTSSFVAETTFLALVLTHFNRSSIGVFSKLLFAASQYLFHCCHDHK